MPYSNFVQCQISQWFWIHLRSTYTLVDIRLKIILFFACLLGGTAELPEDVYIISRLVSYEWGQRTNSSIFQGRKTSGCLYYKKQKGGKWQFSVFKREAGCDQPNAFRSAKDTLNLIRFGPYRFVLFLTEQAWSHGDLRTRELGQDPSHVSMGD